MPIWSMPGLRFRVASDAAAKECATGKATRCAGKTATRVAAAGDLEKAQGYAILMRAKLDVLKPSAYPHTGHAHTAEVLASLPFVTADAETIETGLHLDVPFIIVLISEVATLKFCGMDLRHRSASASKMPVETVSETKAAALENVGPLPLQCFPAIVRA